MRSARTLSVLVVITMVIAIAYGFVSGDFREESSEILGLPWGKVTLIDLYAGLAIFGGWIAVRERSWRRSVGWWVLLVILGNLTAGIYLAYASFRSDDLHELAMGNRRA